MKLKIFILCVLLLSSLVMAQPPVPGDTADEGTSETPPMPNDIEDKETSENVSDNSTASDSGEENRGLNLGLISGFLDTLFSFF